MFVDFVVVSTMGGSMLKREGRVVIRRCAGQRSRGIFRSRESLYLGHINKYWNIVVMSVVYAKVRAKAFSLINCSKDIAIFKGAWSMRIVTDVRKRFDYRSTGTLANTTKAISRSEVTTFNID